MRTCASPSKFCGGSTIATPRARLHLLGVPFNSAGRTDGVARAPAVLRQAGLVDAIRTTRYGVEDRGDVGLADPVPARDADSHVIAPDRLAEMIPAVRREVAQSLDAGAFPLVIGGDCPVLLGCLGATGLDSPPGLLFVDGHEDAWPPAQSTTGEAADMELGFALGLTLETLPEALAREIPRIDPDRVVLIGPRDGDELAGAGVASVRDRVTVIGPEALVNPEHAVEMATQRLAAMGSWWLHVDLDVLSTESLPAVDYGLPGGIEWEQLTRLTSRALSAPGIIGWDVTIYNPDLDPDGEGARDIVRYLTAAFGD